MVIILLTTLFGLSSLIPVEGRIMCFDQKTEIDRHWEFSGSYKYVESTRSLPPAMGKVVPAGNRVWFVEGAGTGKEVKITTAPGLYTDKARLVQIYIRYFDKSPRRASVLPIKGSLPLVTLPASTGSDWSEVRFDINPQESPIEISAFLSQGQYILFDKIIVAVDGPLPGNPAAIACNELNIDPSSLGIVRSPTTGVRSPPSSPLVTRAASSGGGNGPGATAVNSSTNTIPGECTSSSAPPAECKCNCLCNCNKC